MNLDVPFNTKTKVELSQNEFKTLRINGLSILDFKKEGQIEVVNNSNIVLGSGKYSISFRKSQNH